MWTHVGLLLLVTCGVHGYGGGAPDGGCPTMRPGHVQWDVTGRPLIEPQPLPSPYLVRLSRYNYTGGENITITIRGGTNQTFRGFLIQVRRADWRMDTRQPLGSFTAYNSNISRLTCSQFQNRGLTHKNASTNELQELTTTWTAPANPEGHLVVYATIAERRERFWVKESSDILYDPSADPLPTGTPPTPTTGGPETTSALSTLPPIDTGPCGRDKGCFRLPAGCSSSACSHLVTWRTDGSYVRFELEIPSDGWVAVGFSKSRNMSSASVSECVLSRSSSQVRIQQSYNLDGKVHQNTVLNNPILGLDTSASEGSYVDGRIRCRFRRARIANGTGTDEGRFYPLTDGEKYYLLLAKGPVDTSDNKLKHDAEPKMSTLMVSVDQNIDVGSPRSAGTISHIHGIYCLVVFAVLLKRHL